MVGRPAKESRFPVVFFFNDTATTEIYTLSLHDALPISVFPPVFPDGCSPEHPVTTMAAKDRKSTRLNSSHGSISYAVFCLKTKTTHLNSSHGRISYATDTRCTNNNDTI